MMKTPFPLIHAYFDGTITPKQQASLAAWLKEDSRNAQVFAREAFIENRIHATIAGQAYTQLIAGKNLDDSFGELFDDATTALASEERAETGNRKRRREYWQVALVVVACLTIVVGWMIELWSRVEPEVAQIEDLAMVAHAATEWSESERKFDVGDRVGKTVVRVPNGTVRLDFACGVILSLAGPAELDIMSETRVVLRSGHLKAVVPTKASGFKVYTPNTDVVSLGNRFSIDVSDSGDTNVIAQIGAVEVVYEAIENGQQVVDRCRIQDGEAVSIGHERSFERTTADALAVSMPNLLRESSEPIVQSVSDNFRGRNSEEFFEIVRGGFLEDKRAYVDQIHQWNGVDRGGLPGALVGADLVRVTSSDKYVAQLELRMILACSATVYILFDNQITPPKWLSDGFEETEWKVGLDKTEIGVGPGESIDQVFSVWKQDNVTGKPVILGPISDDKDKLIDGEVNMYGIAVVAINNA